LKCPFGILKLTIPEWETWQNGNRKEGTPDDIGKLGRKRYRRKQDISCKKKLELR